MGSWNSGGAQAWCARAVVVDGTDLLGRLQKAWGRFCVRAYRSFARDDRALGTDRGPAQITDH